MNYMVQLQQRRRENLKLLARQYELQRALSEAIGLSVPQISHILTGEREMGDVIARRIETALGKPLCWMDRDPDSGKIMDPDTHAVLSDSELLLISHYQRMTIQHREMLQEMAKGYIALENAKAVVCE